MDVVLEQVDAYNARDLERFLATYHADTIITGAEGNEMLRGHEAMRGLYGALFAQSPQLRCEVVSRLDVGKWVILRERCSGMVLEGFPTDVDAGVVYTVEDGLISRVQFLM